MIWEQYLDELVFIIHRDPEGGFWARAEGCGIFTQADDLDELNEMIVEAVDCYFDDEESKPRSIL
ncbi:type II toxin-antitoxin system HicB family antitoxin [bacterium]|nr:type II toxin-antitoxin system HicB family antitoxin [bacterium]